MQKEKQRLRY